MINDFHASEIKPLKKIYALSDKGHYSCIGFFKENILCAYAFLCYESRSGYFLLDYFAVNKDMRGQGIGGKCLCRLNQVFTSSKGIILETEDPLFSFDDTDLKIREKRISFYEKNGFARYNISSRIYNANYIIMSRNFDGKKSSETDIYNDTDKIYKIMFTEKEYADNVSLNL